MATRAAPADGRPPSSAFSEPRLPPRCPRAVRCPPVLGAARSGALGRAPRPAQQRPLQRGHAKSSSARSVFVRAWRWRCCRPAWNKGTSAFRTAASGAGGGAGGNGRGLASARAVPALVTCACAVLSLALPQAQPWRRRRWRCS